MQRNVIDIHCYGLPGVALACLLPWPAAQAQEAQDRFMLEIGYRQDSLDWSIADSDGSPNVLSELEWRDLDIFQLQGTFTSLNEKQLYFRGMADFGRVFSGVNQDSDYAGNDRSLEFSRSVNGVDGSWVMDLSGGFGKAYAFGEQGRHRFIPLLGYSFHAQRMRMVDGNQVLSNTANARVYDPSGGSDPIAVGPFSGLDSSYDADWHGPWLGMDVFWDLRERGMPYARFEAHWVDYSAQANWNLRSDLAHPVSFEHFANGSGWLMELGWRNQLSEEGWAWGAGMSISQWQTRAGVDRIYFSSSSAETRLNEVNWSSSQLNFNLSKQF